MPKARRLHQDEVTLFSEPMEEAMAALEEYLSAVAEDEEVGPRLQARARTARKAIGAARDEWWKIGLEVQGLHQRVVQLEGEVARLERYVGKLTNALDESDWITGI